MPGQRAGVRLLGNTERLSYQRDMFAEFGQDSEVISRVEYWMRCARSGTSLRAYHQLVAVIDPDRQLVTNFAEAIWSDSLRVEIRR